jgi:transcriptional repressor NF-X1
VKRNAAFAEAFNIAPDHSDSHIPYSDTTLDLFKENQAWALTQERELRQFALDIDRKVLRCKPMQTNQRAFMHSLAEDFGLDSESHDQPPHRAVSIFKTPRFVSAPRKMLTQALRIRVTQAASAPKAEILSAANVAESFNALLLSSPKFGLTIDDLEAALARVFATQPSAKFETTFLPSDEVLLRASSKNFANALSPIALEEVLKTLKPAVAKMVTDEELAGSTTLCHADASLNILRRERGMQTNPGGWNAVAGRAAQRVAKVDDKVSVSAARGRGGRITLGLKKKDPAVGELS